MKGIAYLILTAVLLSLVIFGWTHVDLRSSDHIDDLLPTPVPIRENEVYLV